MYKWQLQQSRLKDRDSTERATSAGSWAMLWRCLQQEGTGCAWHTPCLTRSQTSSQGAALKPDSRSNCSRWVSDSSAVRLETCQQAGAALQAHPAATNMLCTHTATLPWVCMGRLWRRLDRSHQCAAPGCCGPVGGADGAGAALHGHRAAARMGGAHPELLLRAL